MNVLHVVAGNLDEGAAQGAYILHENLLSKGINSLLLTNSFITSGYKSVVSVSDGLFGKIKSVVRMKLDNAYKFVYRDKEMLKFSAGLAGYDFTKSDLYHQADIIHLHWVCNGFFNVKILNSIEKPVIWTLRDMWPMTGGCHYAVDCNKFQQQCGRCPHLGSKKDHDLSTVLQKRKKKVYSNRIRFVGISHWITKQAKKSSLMRNYSIDTIFNNIDLSSFFPSDKTKAKKDLDLSLNKLVLLFGAQNLNSIYKGYDLLEKVLQSLEMEAEIVFFGREAPAFLRDLNVQYRFLGFLGSEKLRIAYTAADVFISTSRMEAFGKTVAEAMACGTPVVCFDKTGSADIVDHRENGYLAEPFIPEDIVEGIKYISGHPNYNSMSKKAIEKTKRCFDAGLITDEYINLYNLIARGNQAS